MTTSLEALEVPQDERGPMDQPCMVVVLSKAAGFDAAFAAQEAAAAAGKDSGGGGA